MAWIKLDDGLPEHAKIVSVGGDAAWLHICALAYANRNLTDGHIPSKVLARLSDRRQAAKLAARLVDVGMWHLDDDGWLIHDYLEYQPPRAKVMEEREKARERMAKARGSSQDVQANNSGSSPNPDPTRPDLSLVTSHDRQTLPACPSVVEEAVTLYADVVYLRDPSACKKTPAKFKAGVARNAHAEFDALILAHLERKPEATRVDIAYAVFGVTESELLTLGVVEREDLDARIARRKREREAEAGLNGAAS